MEKYTTFFPRLVALLIDSFIMLPLIIFDDWFHKAEFPMMFFYFWIPLSTFISPVYTILMHGKYGQTLGKMYMNVKVVKAKSEENISFAQALLREIPFVLLKIGAIALNIMFFGDNPDSERLQIPLGVFGFFVFTWYSADIIVFLFDNKRRALHDFIAGTVVVKTNS